MTKTKTFIIIAVLLACLSVFGAWTGTYDAETRYADAPFLATYADETIYYTSKQETGPVNTAGNCPFYKPVTGLENSCGAVAGSIIVAYYDKYFPNLIPGWDSYYASSGNYRSQNATYVTPLMKDLYTLMRTNVDDVGVSRTDFLNGLTSYVNGKGYQVSYQSVLSGSTLNYEQCKSAIDNNKVIALLVKPTNIYTFDEGSGSDMVSSIAISGAHIMVAYGYYQIKYYNASGLFRTDTYLMVATGRQGTTSAYYKINSTTTEAAYIVNIT